MESAAVLRSFNCAVGSIATVQSSLERPYMVSLYNSASDRSFIEGLPVGRRSVSSPVSKKRSKGPCVKASETSVTATSDASSGSSLQGSLEKKKLWSTTFPNGFVSLWFSIDRDGGTGFVFPTPTSWDKAFCCLCDETNVAELELKVGEFEMLLKRNIGATRTLNPIVSSSTPPPVLSKPMVESGPAVQATLLPKSSAETTSPFKYVSLEKSSKLAALEASGSNAYVLVSSPTVGSFRRGRTFKGKKQPPICKEGNIIKEGQVIGVLDQFGSQLPAKSDVAGEVIKLLFNDGGKICVIVEKYELG